MTEGKTTIRLDDDVDRWKWVCPRGHRQWEPVNHHFWCASCARQTNEDAEPTFTALRNRATDEVVDRDDVRLVTPAGRYESEEGSA
ncbi:hypothetical protein [Halostella sp. PRR32]|uniref:hypothetical protein n=1 Tax=Halostella sp. PRR32 TaxID=3098147 RepID=UPI002B1DE5B7|nr:hypothetical protein [Halostella sp. PRR32]